MNKTITLIIGILIFTAFGCQESKEDKAFKIFNEGVTFSLDAGKMMDEGKVEEGKKKYELSIEKFQKTLQFNPSHKGVLSAIGFSHYELKNYDEAIIWFTKATKVQPNFAVNYQFLGLSQINKGKVEEGEKSIGKAFKLDNSEELKSNTIGSLVEIGNLAYSYGDAYEKEGKIKMGDDYRKFGVKVLISAMGFSDDDKEIGKLIEGYAVKINDESLTKWIEDKMK